MRYANWMAVALSAALVSISAAVAQEPAAPGPTAEGPPEASARLNPFVAREPLFATPDIPPVKPPPRGGYAWAARSHVLGPVAKLRRGRYTMSRIRELKAERTNSVR